ncbi:ABC transporter substrate-binding protein [Sinomonas sp. JGH33]|uniref:ABC transporter substrate-binding protein n=1 Tax=Sinomonas terricola TaxID=3110330 RepID=A0ABU5T887_9MICC|nr:ABC transporter substrate-binding protein [Sinomonas sp. JGH33]MEA5455729.1 ABC transporter substrate-binding protein [Sinomonas sp. JGH33]
MSTTSPHRSKSSARLAFYAAPLAAALLAGCTAGGSSGGAAAADGGSSSIVVAFKHEVNTLDPLRADYAQTNMIDNAIYEPLVKFDGSNKLVGQLASEFTVAPDSSSVSFSLRSGVTFHDGSPLIAADVKYSLDRYIRLGQGIASALSGYQSTTVTDDSHVVVHLKAPNAYFVNGLANVYIVEAALVTKNAGTDDAQGWLQAHDAGTGPFQSDGQAGTDGAALSRYDKYWAFDAKRPSHIVFRRIDESATERDELKAGNVDIALGLSATDAASLKGTDKEVAFLKTAGQTQLFFNTSSGPTANPQLRQGLQLAFDYKGGFDKILNSNGSIASGILSDTLSCRPDSVTSSQQIDKAKQLISQSGLGSQALELRFQPSDPVQTQLATLFQSNLRDIGVTVNLVPIAFPDYLKSLGSAATIPSMMLLNDYALTPDPGSTLDKLYNSKNIGSTNKAAYKNATVDGLLNQTRTLADVTKRCDLYKQIQDQVSKDAASVNMYQVAFPVGYRDGLSGITPDWSVTPMSVFNVRVG